MTELDKLAESLGKSTDEYLAEYDLGQEEKEHRKGKDKSG